MTQQFELAGTVTNDAIKRAFAADRRRRAGAKRGASAEAELALQCRACGLPQPHTQYHFAKAMGRQFRADYAWPEYQLLVEVQGGIWRKGGGAHSHPLDILRDVEKHKYAALLGLLVLPVTTDEVRKGQAIEWIERVLAARGWKR